MKKVQTFFKNTVVKYGSVIAGCAFAFAIIAANSSCVLPYYEPNEPANLGKFKKFNG